MNLEHGLDPVAPRHQDIGDDQIRTVVAIARQGVRTVLGVDDLVSGPLKHETHGFPQGWLIVDNQDFRHGTSHVTGRGVFGASVDFARVPLVEWIHRVVTGYSNLGAREVYEKGGGVIGRRWLVPAAVALAGIGGSCFAFWIVDQADRRRVRDFIEFRTDWRAHDLEEQIRLSGSAVEKIALAIAADAPLDAEAFRRLATRARNGFGYMQALQWAPRVGRDLLPAFEQAARGAGLPDYRVFDVTPDFLPTELEARKEYFPVLFDARFAGPRRAEGLALGRYDGRRVPMEKARDEGGPVATLPVRPIGPPGPERLYLLFWPIYDGVAVPGTVEERRERLRGYAVGNINLAALLGAVLDEDAPKSTAAIRFSVTSAHRENPGETAVAVYSPDTRQVQIPAPASSAFELRLTRHFAVFDQHWDLVFDYPSAAIEPLRSRTASWGWLTAGLLLTGALAGYLLIERGRTERIEALMAQRTAELQQTSAQLQQAQKMEAIGNLTGGMAHDFNNLLTVIIGNLDTAVSALDRDPQTRRQLELALDAARRGAGLIRQLLAFARRQRLSPELTDANELVAGMLRLLNRILGEDIEIAFEPAPTLWPVMIDPSLLGSAIANLAANARDAMPEGGCLTIATRNVHLDPDYAEVNPDVAPGDFVLLEVSDNGAGMPAEMLDRAFEPFFTTKDEGRGSGLGLSMVFGFVKQSHSHIKLYSEAGHGTTVRIYLPRVREAADVPVSAAPEVRHAAPGHETILLVEDKDDVRQVVGRQLTQLGYKVVAAGSARLALDRLNSADAEFDLLLTDLVMPGGMNGRDLARAALAVRPGLKVLFMSGYPGDALRNGHSLPVGDNFLAKPFGRDELAHKLRQVLES